VVANFDSTCVRNAGWYAGTGISELMRPSESRFVPASVVPEQVQVQTDIGNLGGVTHQHSVLGVGGQCAMSYFTSTPVSAAAAFVQHYGQSATAGISGEAVQQPSANVVALHQSAMRSSAPPFVPTTVPPV
jgi:hypothetical protein